MRRLLLALPLIAAALPAAALDLTLPPLKGASCPHRVTLFYDDCTVEHVRVCPGLVPHSHHKRFTAEGTWSYSYTLSGGGYSAGERWEGGGVLYDVDLSDALHHPLPGEVQKLNHYQVEAAGAGGTPLAVQRRLSNLGAEEVIVSGQLFEVEIFHDRAALSDGRIWGWTVAYAREIGAPVAVVASDLPDKAALSTSNTILRVVREKWNDFEVTKVPADLLCTPPQ